MYVQSTPTYSRIYELTLKFVRIMKIVHFISNSVFSVPVLSKSLIIVHLLRIHVIMNAITYLFFHRALFQPRTKRIGNPLPKGIPCQQLTL